MTVSPQASFPSNSEIDIRSPFDGNAPSPLPIVLKPSRNVSGIENPAQRQNVEQSLETSWSQVAKCSVWDLDFARLTMDQTIDQIERQIEEGVPSQVITANLNFIMLCDKYQELREVVARASLVLCDGMPILWRSRWSGEPLPERVAGSDLIFRLCERAAARQHRLYFLGAAEGVAAQAAQKLVDRYPGLCIAGVECPPFRPWTQEEEDAMCDRIRKANVDILFVAFGQPKGEIWIDQHLERLGAKVCIQLGATFDFIAGDVQRAPRWMQKLGLEWLHRTLSDPKRLGPRYFNNGICLIRRLRRDLLDATC